MTGYDYETQPYDHQRSAFEESWAAEYLCTAHGNGHGKIEGCDRYNGCIVRSGQDESRAYRCA